MDATRWDGQQQEMRPCDYCHRLFEPKRPKQAFCHDKCRWGYHLDIGTEGVVAGVTRLQRGRVSLVLHFEAGPAAERAIRLMKGERKRVV